MKKVVFVLSILFFAMTVNAQNLNLQSGDLPKFDWGSPTEHNFGKIAQGVPVTTTFEFQNTGTTELILSGVKPSCGCTTPDYTKEPIQPGKKGFIKATFNAASVGVFHKSITVTSNVSEQPVVLTIKGEVLAKDEKAVAIVTPEPVKAQLVVEKPVSTTAVSSNVNTVKISKTVNVLFANGSSTISAADIKALDGIVTELKTNANASIILNGYASKTGKASVNKKLSEKRAEAVKSQIVKSGVEAKRITVASYGDTGSTGDLEGDRRVEVLLLQ